MAGFYVIGGFRASVPKKRMRKMYFLLILLWVMAAGGAVWGQARIPIRPWTPLPPGKLEMLRGFWLRNETRDSVCTLSPDPMPCLVPSKTGIERMPVKKLRNRFPVDPMMNGIAPN
jgi:hypothetical protein